MLALNDKIIDLNGDSPEAKRVKSAVQRLKELSNNNIKIVYTDIHVSTSVDDKRQKETATSFVFPLTERIFTNGVDERWTYFEDRKRHGEEYKYVPRRKDFRGDINFNDENADMGLLFFMVYISPFCESIEYLKPADHPQNNKKSVQKHFRILLPGFDAIKKAELMKKQTKATHMIYNELEFDRLVLIAAALNIPNAVGLTDSELRNSIHDVSVVSERNLDTFFDKLKYKPKTQLEATVQRAVDEKIVIFRKPFGKALWNYKAEGDQKTGDLIMECVPGQDPHQTLISYYEKNLAAYEVLQGKLEKKKATKKEKTDDIIVGENTDTTQKE